MRKSRTPAPGEDSRKLAEGTAQEAITGKGSAHRILEAASELLATDGYEAFSMRKVAAMVGLSQTAIYRHYADKADLVGKVIDSGYSMMRSRIEALQDPALSPADLLAGGIRAYIAFAEENPRLFKAVLLQDLGPNQAKVNAFSPGVSGRRKTFEMMAGLVARGVAEGLFAPCDPEPTAQAVWAAMFGLAARVALETGSEGAGEAAASARRRLVVERQIEIILRGLSGGRGYEEGKA